MRLGLAILSILCVSVSIWLITGFFERPRRAEGGGVAELAVEPGSVSTARRLAPFRPQQGPPADRIPNRAPLEDPCEGRVRAFQRELDGLRLRLSRFERLSLDRVRRTAELEAVLADGGLNHPEVYRPFLDYLVAPELLAEDPEGFLDAVEQAMLAAQLPSAPVTSRGQRVVPLEDPGAGPFRAKVKLDRGPANDGISGANVPLEFLTIQMSLPESLGGTRIMLKAERHRESTGLSLLSMGLGANDREGASFEFSQDTDGGLHHQAIVRGTQRQGVLSMDRVREFHQFFEAWYDRNASMLR